MDYCPTSGVANQNHIIPLGSKSATAWPDRVPDVQSHLDRMLHNVQAVYCLQPLVPRQVAARIPAALYLSATVKPV